MNKKILVWMCILVLVNIFPVSAQSEEPSVSSARQKLVHCKDGICSSGISDMEYTFAGEKVNLSIYALINGEKVIIPFSSSFNTSESFGFLLNESEINETIKIKTNEYDRKIYLEMEDLEEYAPSINAYVLERNLEGQYKVVTNQIGQREKRQLKRYIDFSAIFGKENNLYDSVIAERNTTICLDYDFVLDSCIQEANTTINETRKIPRNYSYSFIKQGTSWIIEFFNLFDLDPSFIDDTDSNWNTGTFDKMYVKGTGGSANLTGENQSGHFASQVFDGGDLANWTNISIATEAYYGVEIGRAQNDSNSSNSILGINTTKLVLLLHFNNESAYGENDSQAYDFAANNIAEFQNYTPSNQDLGVKYTANGAFGRGVAVSNTATGAGTRARINITNSAFNLNFSAGPVNNVSICTWWKLTTKTNDEGTIFDKGIGQAANSGEYGLFIFPDGSLSIRVGGQTAESITTANGVTAKNLVSNDTNLWHFTCLLFNTTRTGQGSTTARLYFDNSLVKQVSTMTGGGNQPTNQRFHLLLGQRIDGGRRANLSFDEFSFWDRNLNVDELNNMYLRGAWRLNLSARSCDDSACASESYTQIINGSGSNTLNGSKMPMDLAKNRYFQYNITYSNFSAFATRLNVNNVSIEYFNVGPDVTPPSFLTNPYNKTTTNQSAEISWTTDEDANYTLTIGLCPSFTGANSFSNATFASTHNKWVDNLQNSTNYCVNATAADSSNNKASSNASFTTAANAVQQQSANEQEGDDAILAGINTSEIWTAAVYDSYQVGGSNLTQQFRGRFDKFAIKGNKRWAINYVSQGESAITGIFNITPTLYVLQIQDLTSVQITQQVGSFINSTYP